MKRHEQIQHAPPYEIEAIATVTFGRDENGDWLHHYYFEFANGIATLDGGVVAAKALKDGLPVLAFHGSDLHDDKRLGNTNPGLRPEKKGQAFNFEPQNHSDEYRTVAEPFDLVPLDQLDLTEAQSISRFLHHALDVETLPDQAAVVLSEYFIAAGRRLRALGSSGAEALGYEDCCPPSHQGG